MPIRRKIVRALGFSLLGLLIIIAAGALWFSQSYKGIVKRELPAASAKASDSLYRAQTGDVDVDLAPRDVTFTDLELTPNAEELEKLRRDFDMPPVLLSVRIPRVDIRHLSVSQYLKDKELVADELHIINPVIRITRLTKQPRQKDTAKKPSRIRAVKVGLITITNPDVRYTDETAPKSSPMTAKGGSIHLTDWRFNLRDKRDSTRLFYASRAQLQLEALGIRDPSGMYQYNVRRAVYDQKTGVAELNELRVRPTVSREAFYRRAGHQKEMYDMRFPLIRLTGLDWQRMVYGKELAASGGLIRGGDLRIYLDRVPPPNTRAKKGSFPNQMLMKLKLPLYIPRLQVQDGQLNYVERNEKTLREGTVRISGIGGQITNVTNIRQRISRAPECTIALRGVFKESPIAATFHFPLASRTGAFRVEGSLGAMDGTRLNDLSTPLALAQIKSMQMNGLQFRMAGDEKGARGSLTLLYEDLKMQLLEANKERRLDKKTATTLLTNKLLVYPANPMPGKDVRVADPVKERDTTKSFFNLIWQTIYTGTLQSAQRFGFVDNAVERKARKQEEKRKKKESANQP